MTFNTEYNKLSFPTLKDDFSNYESWSQQCLAELIAHNVDHTIGVMFSLNPPSATGTVEERQAYKKSLRQSAIAFTIITRHLPEGFEHYYRHEKNPATVWQIVQNRCRIIRTARLPQVRHEWNQLRYCDYPNVREYDCQLQSLKGQLKAYGEDHLITDEELIKKTIYSLPRHFGHRVSKFAMQFPKYIDLYAELEILEGHDKVQQLVLAGANSISSSNSPMRSYIDNCTLPTCQLCDRIGHTAKECKRCRFCDQASHRSKDCWYRDTLRSKASQFFNKRKGKLIKFDRNTKAFTQNNVKLESHI